MAEKMGKINAVTTSEIKIGILNGMTEAVEILTTASIDVLKNKFLPNHDALFNHDVIRKE